MKKVSIIIPTFNSVKYLQQTLDSLLAQTYPGFECILVDDGSSDDTENIVNGYLKKDDRFRFFKRPQELPKGPSSCRNYGVGKAVGDYLIFLDADDLLDAGCLKNRTDQFAQHQECDFLVFQMERFLSRPDFSKKTKETQTDKSLILESFLHLHGQWPITSPIYKTTFFKKIGFNEKLVVFEDLEAAVRAIVLSTEFKIFETIDCYYRNDENYKAKYDSIAIKTKMIKGFQTLLSSMIELMKSNDESRFRNQYIRSCLVQSYKKLFLSVILNNSKIFRNDNDNLLQFLSQNKFLSNKEAFRLRFAHKIVLPFATIKGSGMARLIQFLYR